MTQDKSIALDKKLIDLGSFIIGFSGGVDSAFLLYRAKLLDSLKMKAVTIRTPYIPA